MKDHYQVLGIPRNATARDIKDAFKKLAVRYHPDKNPGDKTSEDIFKEITLAYDILSDSDKKARYDLILAYSDSTKSYQTGPYTPNPQYNPYRKKQYPPPGRYQKQFGWTYIRNQLLAFGFVFCIAILVLSVQAAYEYTLRKERERVEKWRLERMEAAILNFSSGKFVLALDTLQKMIEEFPGEIDLKDRKSSMLKQVKNMANNEFGQSDFREAARLFRIARDYEEPYLLNLDVHFKLAQSYENLQEYEKAAEAINVVLARDSENINLNLQLATLYNSRLNEPEKALEYFDVARGKIRDFLESVYGSAYELVVNPTKVPDLYYQVYKGRGMANVKLGNYRESIRDFNWAIFFRPGNGEDYYLRALSYFQLDDPQRTCRDLSKAIEVGYEPARTEQAKKCK